MIRKAFILAGGKGERLRPLTNEIPKPLIEVKGKPILQYSVELLREAGVKEIVLGVGYKAEKIKVFFGNGEKFGVKVFYSEEKEALGTGGALKHAEKFFANEKKFIMLNGDNLADYDFKKMIEEHEANNAAATIALVKVDDPSSYGVAELQEKKIVRFVEKPKREEAPSNYANAGAYVLNKEIFKLLPHGFSLIEKNAFPQLAGEGKLFAFFHEGQWFPTDDKKRLEDAEKNFNAR
ncbi:MAG: nucleotidyltransferase family protein [Candidatus Diapherotrites archaeon]